jgi:phosphohistidine phosphatase SixA
VKLPENIYLIRHGYQAENDEGLSPLGRYQAVQAGERLEKEGFDRESALISSTAIRCAATAEIIATVLNLKSEITYDERLCEMEEQMLHLENPLGVISNIAEKKEASKEQDPKLAVIFHGGVIMRMVPELGTMDISEGGCIHKFCTVNPPQLD